ncbi:DUF481 domain-containing protein [Prevotella histicola]|uniref:DUF481 domain-containing protein n=1 Tax=Prevotella histicola JCM 15637 = DNF00424 TaxID=1236504 RepID=A0AAW3FH82_9BACT|nr:DUF481 domain-containing protein [Prevotella histicola]KGF29162.1 hypothetical protein HMPREF2132_03345 [Prevotella histicola JCM 15637 = DNF00424]MBF1399469.1 DUF481 domain-containing protein [Prevotella histicola]MBF1425221.1 DUF481 domain-containing protein [Prevotella histicola]MBS5897576.1 DUF481 domain-containing protein [Prevotella histicola]MBW4757264.1 DUF481 domain-containing protein [Prevotella histicola]
MKKKVLFSLLILSFHLPIYSQMLFTENLTLDIDSTKTIQGSLLPVVDFKTESENILTIKNTANLNILIKHRRVINLINKLEFSTYGNKVTMSGGHVHVEYRYLLTRAFEVYPYAESQWADSRGMEYKISAGLQSRYRLVNKEKFLMFAAVGLFYEFEKWKDPTPNPPELHVYSRSIKTHLSLSFRQQIGDKWDLTTTVIHQAKPDSYFKEARFGGAVDLKYNITPTIGINGAYRCIYDTAPIVPIRKFYNSVEAGLSINF